MRDSIERVMQERNLDRTSVIKLALYLFSKYMAREDVRQQSLHELVSTIERMNPRSYPKFHDFGED